MSIERHQLYLDILEKHKGIVFKVARSYCSNEFDREDLVQEILAQIWRSLDTYNDAFKVTTWMYRVALNVAISFYRKDKSAAYKHTEIEDRLLTYDMVQESENEQNLSALYAFINELNDIDKAVLLMYLEGENQAEIAANLNITISNVSTKISRIKQKLKLKTA
ncbi:MAG: RNA polymerase sigma factor [Aestuariibacter sp.]|uniref:RNA polymerase sigma factor n=1 Tax=Marisediminitalea aggregata TaxID=634436 RepID=UPI0020CF7AF4|nr:RNA polymerase sigma factor [Marisediminitalea aggregata]MCP3864094.1 RNA polymerase sigma factor [Aestuariibacter sp.]MCP4233093.1 RNA polymerase sigma factor [Aestuariibacter sp.]MCP4528013.1 RNA polymerase sigma factor [Aestuariibacter sp.]MCP4946077.1 RNA polymerase sigma factor [Aestuariibacter sp.]MCP5009697.1 RNA polymerase sigma factor [Aestuariibacter sp.]